jgi:MoaA/NifB/PqqE/SkfB family radical SAM enzyme
LNALRYLTFARRGFDRAGPPLHLTVFVTGRCNLRCRHCFHWREVAAGTPGPPLEKLERLADSAARMGPLLWVSLGGGEPFLRADLPLVAAAFGRHGLRHLAIPTNGLVEARQHEAVEEILAACPDTYVSIAVSIDGPPAVHDSIRGLAGAHARAVEAARRFRAQARSHERLGLGLIFTVTRENQDVLAQHIEELARAIEPDNVTINLARGTALDETPLAVDLDRYREVVETKLRLQRERVLPYFDFPLARLAVARDRLMYGHVERVARGDERAWLPCTAGTLSAVVFEDGSVHPCEILGREIGRLDDVDWDLAKLWESDSARELRREIRRTRCTCTWECAQADNVLFGARTWPRLALEVLRA